MVYFDRAINRYYTDRQIPILNKEELLEKYWNKFLLYLYQEATMLEEIQNIEKKEWKSKQSTSSELERIWGLIIKKYWELWFVKYMIVKIQLWSLPYWLFINLIRTSHQNIYNDMMKRLN